MYTLECVTMAWLATLWKTNHHFMAMGQHEVI